VDGVGLLVAVVRELSSNWEGRLLIFPSSGGDTPGRGGGGLLPQELA